MSGEVRKDIRCFCNRRPLLAVYGVDEHGEIFIHVKVYKQSRIYAEMFVSADAIVKIRCRECLRLHRIKIIQGEPVLDEERTSPRFVETETPRRRFAGGQSLG